jgi:hypothetical protein
MQARRGGREGREDVRRNAKGDCAHCPCAASHAASDNIFRWLFQIRLSCSSGRTSRLHHHHHGVSQSETHYLFPFSSAANSDEPPGIMYYSGFFSELRAPHRGTSLSSCVYEASYFPLISPPAGIQGMALESNFPITDNRTLVQRGIPKRIRKVANDPPGTRIRRVVISHSDSHGAGTHWFELCFEIEKPL